VAEPQITASAIETLHIVGNYIAKESSALMDWQVREILGPIDMDALMAASRERERLARRPIARLQRAVAEARHRLGHASDALRGMGCDDY
jgi:hypothetical protein